MSRDLRVTHEPDYKKGRDISVGVFSQFLDAVITDHGRQLGVLFENEKIHVKDIEVTDDLAVVKGTIFHKDIN